MNHQVTIELKDATTLGELLAEVDDRVPLHARLSVTVTKADPPYAQDSASIRFSWDEHPDQQQLDG